MLQQNLLNGVSGCRAGRWLLYPLPLSERIDR